MVFFIGIECHCFNGGVCLLFFHCTFLSWSFSIFCYYLGLLIHLCHNESLNNTCLFFSTQLSFTQLELLLFFSIYSQIQTNPPKIFQLLLSFLALGLPSCHYKPSSSLGFLGHPNHACLSTTTRL